MYHCKLFLRMSDEYLKCLDYGPVEVTFVQPPVTGMRVDLHVRGIPVEPSTFEIIEVTIVPVNDDGPLPPLTQGGWPTAEGPTSIEYWCECELRSPQLGVTIWGSHGEDGSEGREAHVAFINDGLWATTVIPWDELVRRATTESLTEEFDDDDEE